jgi:transcription elongation factor Elf1
MQNVRGFPCPTCGATIGVDATRLLSAAPFFCSGCGLQLQLDASASAESLEALHHYQAAMGHAERSGVLKPVR